MTDTLNPLVLPKRLAAQRQGSLQSAIDTLGKLEVEGFFFRREITLAPIQHGRMGYQLTCFVKRRQRLWTYTTARSEGRVWQDDAGTVFLEGVAQINGWAFTLGLGGYTIVFLFLLVALGAAGGLIGAVVLFFHVWAFYTDRNAAATPLIRAIETFPADYIKKKPITAADLRVETRQSDHPLF